MSTKIVAFTLFVLGIAYKKNKLKIIIGMIMMIEYCSNIQHVNISLKMWGQSIIFFYLGYAYIIVYTGEDPPIFKIKFDLKMLFRVVGEELIWRGFLIQEIVMKIHYFPIRVACFILASVLFIACHNTNNIKIIKHIEMIIFTTILQFVGIYNIVWAIFLHYGRNTTIKFINDNAMTDKI